MNPRRAGVNSRLRFAQRGDVKVFVVENYLEAVGVDPRPEHKDRGLIGFAGQGDLACIVADIGC